MGIPPEQGDIAVYITQELSHVRGLRQRVLLQEDGGSTDECRCGGVWRLVGLAFLKSLAQLKPLRCLHNTKWVRLLCFAVKQCILCHADRHMTDRHEYELSQSCDVIRYVTGSERYSVSPQFTILRPAMLSHVLQQELLCAMCYMGAQCYNDTQFAVAYMFDSSR